MSEKRARCLTCRCLHEVEMKAKAKEEIPDSIDYGTHTLPKRYWTAPKAPDGGARQGG